MSSMDSLPFAVSEAGVASGVSHAGVDTVTSDGIAATGAWGSSDVPVVSGIRFPWRPRSSKSISDKTGAGTRLPNFLERRRVRSKRAANLVTGPMGWSAGYPKTDAPIYRICHVGLLAKLCLCQTEARTNPSADRRVSARRARIGKASPLRPVQFRGGHRRLRIET